MRVGLSGGLALKCLICQTILTILNVTGDVAKHSWPVVYACNAGNRFRNAEVSRCWFVMQAADDLGPVFPRYTTLPLFGFGMVAELEIVS
jgi:hypothetical protein